MAALVGMVSTQTVAASLAAGKARAEAICQTCHGMDGIATMPMVANIAGQQKGYLIDQLQSYRSGKRLHEQMTIVVKLLSDDDIENLALWYSSIKLTLELPVISSSE